MRKTLFCCFSFFIFHFSFLFDAHFLTLVRAHTVRDRPLIQHTCVCSFVHRSRSHSHSLNDYGRKLWNVIRFRITHSLIYHFTINSLIKYHPYDYILHSVHFHRFASIIHASSDLKIIKYFPFICLCLLKCNVYFCEISFYCFLLLASCCCVWFDAVPCLDGMCFTFLQFYSFQHGFKEEKKIPVETGTTASIVKTYSLNNSCKILVKKKPYISATLHKTCVNHIKRDEFYFEFSCNSWFKVHKNQINTINEASVNSWNLQGISY